MNVVYNENNMNERLQKILAHAGVASRIKAEEMIQQGRVSVNGHVITELGSKADAGEDVIKVDGKKVRVAQHHVYILLNKPRRVISTVCDPQGRMKVTDLVPGKEKLYPVGRLDYDTEGLIILTNDGEFTRIVSRAGEQIHKAYQVKVKGVLEEASLKRLRSGIRLADGTWFAQSKVHPIREGNNSWYEVTLTQGRNQQIRRMFQAVGHPVLKLRRVAIGFLKNERLPVGHYRHLTEQEVIRFLRLGETGRHRAAGPSDDRAIGPSNHRVI